MYARYVTIWLPSYDLKKDRISQREEAQKLRKGEKSFL